MSSRPTLFARYYGAHPLHLLTMVAGFALLGYVLIALRPAALWNPGSWWQSVAVWLAAAVIGHDLVLFPLYALADAAIARLPGVRAPSPKVPVRNYIRVPALGAALTLLVFLPGIIEQGADTYHAATGQTQQPFLGRWLLLVATLFAGSALAYAVRLVLTSRRIPEENATG
ncbi:hypothetical protein AO501_00060 [Mycobacterium gordonae]|uniref:Uncharacterized protein n=1 Tax=Mycobacterium gordonae TaxID=1778 RepID=A0A0Q2UIH8_MYCGO|nr:MULTISPECIES: hypothetical protein [Mycobacterium]KQH80560.1 hypothetical protein AO501_00060 [Mycobacterium gordonae]MDP7730754.1 hypothetical protein [Mycobacterium sp. TY813]